MWLFEYFPRLWPVSGLDSSTFPRGRRWTSRVMGKRHGTCDIAILRRMLDIVQAFEVCEHDQILPIFDFPAYLSLLTILG